MPLYESDIRTMQAEDVSQADTAGGRMGTTEVHDGQVGNVFGRLGREDRAAGAVDLVKLYLWGDSEDQTEAHNSSTILTTRPGDSHVSTVLFRPGSAGARSLHTDERGDAQSYVESYLVAAEPLIWYVWGDHPQGSPELRLWSRTSNAAVAPAVGDVLYLDGTELDASPDGDRYYQVTDVSTETRIITVGQGITVEASICYLALNKPLAAAISGISVTTSDMQDPDPAVHATVVADAARFFGCQALAAEAEAGDSVLTVASVYDHIVPTQTADISLGNPLAVGDIGQTVTTGGRSVQVLSHQHSLAIDITAANRSTTYTRTLGPIPATGTIRVHYRALGRWYTIQEGDSGAYGELTRIDADTVAATLLERPDADTAVVWLWASPVHVLDVAGSTSVADVGHTGALPSPAEPGTASIEWLSNSTTKTAIVSSTGDISGDGAVGYLVHATGDYWVEWSSNIPDSGTDLEWTYTERTTATEVFSDSPDGSGDVAVTLAATPEPDTLAVTYEVQREQTRLRSTEGPPRLLEIPGGASSYDSRKLRVEEGSGTRRTHRRTETCSAAGSLSGLGGTLSGTSLTVRVTGDYDYERYHQSTGDYWETETGSETYLGPMTVRYQVAGAVTTAQTYTVTLSDLEIDLLPLRSDPIYPGSATVRLGASNYTDIGDGNLYADDDAVVGSIDYLSGRATLTEWSSASATVLLVSGLVQRGEPQQTDYIFRTAAAPIVAGELGIQATETDGDAISFQVPTDGAIAETECTGTARHDIGLVSLSFTDPVWPGTLRYSGTVRKTIPMDPDLLGLDPTRLGDGRVPIYRAGDLVVIQEWLEEDLPDNLTAGQTITLEQDDLAQVYLYDGAGEDTQQLPTGLVGAQEIDLGATFLEYCLLRDADGRNIPGGLFAVDYEAGVITMASPLNLTGYVEPLVARYLSRVDPDLWDVDLAAGEITMASPLDLSAYTEPLSARYRIEDERLVSEVQITGEVSVSAAITHDYSTNAVVASKLRHGDLQARVDPVWAQNTWTGVWSDDLIGSAPTGGFQYDDTGYPPLVNNHGAITERWRLSRRSDGQWDVIGETVGVLAVWAGTSTLQVMYRGRVALELYHEGLGGGDAAGNQLRINTYGCMGPYWALRCTRPGAADLAEDSATMAQRVDAD
jgi:hypothetical protein